MGAEKRAKDSFDHLKFKIPIGYLNGDSDKLGGAGEALHKGGKSK